MVCFFLSVRKISSLLTTRRFFFIKEVSATVIFLQTLRSSYGIFYTGVSITEMRESFFLAC